MPVPAEPDNLLQRSKNFRHDIKLALSPGRIVFALISCAILIPCFWHRHIQAGDSGSHVYNAWLADLVAKNQAPGVYVVWRWDNILFDLLLSGFGKFVGWDLAEKLAVSVCVLIFFWGVFFLITTLSGRQPWVLAPGLAMLAYGYTFHVGFFNYYLSIGLACVGLALIRRGGKNNFLISIALSPLILLSHRLGLLWFLATAAYLFLWRNLPRRKPLLPVLAILGVIATRMAVHFLAARGFWSDVGWPERPFYILNGADQFAVTDHDRFVDAVLGFGELDELIVLMFGSFESHRGHVHAGDLEFGRHPRTVIRGAVIGSGQMICQHGGLLPQRRDQPVDLAAVLRAFADDIDVVGVD